MSQTFISHSTQDDEVVEAIRHSLDRHRVFGWTDSRRMQPGDPVDPKIEQAIQHASHFVVVLSGKAMDSAWVMKEVEIAKRVREEKPGYRIIPILLDGIEPNVVGPWLGENTVTIQIGTQHDSVAEGVARLVSVLHQDLLIPPDDTGDDQLDLPLADLVLELTSPSLDTSGGTNRAQASARLVFHPAEGEPQHGDAFHFVAPLGPIEAGDLRWYLESYYRWTSDVFRDRAKRIENQLPVWGRQLFDAALAVPQAQSSLQSWRRPDTPSLRRFTVLVDPNVGRALLPVQDDDATGRSAHPTDDVDDTGDATSAAQQAATLLLALPWELIHDQHGYLFQGMKGVRVRRRLPDADVVEPQPGEPPVRVLLVSPRPDDERAAYIDHRVSARPVVDALAILGDLAKLTLLDPPTLPALSAELRRAYEANEPYHVVHFDGHGVYDRRHGWGALCFEDPRDTDQVGSVEDDDTGRPRGRRTHSVPAEELAAILRDSDLPLFVLEACQSAQAEDDPTASVAGKLLACGVTSVVAMSHSVLVETARRFVTVFYRELIRGRRIGQAMLEAQHALFNDRSRGRTFGGELTMHDWFVPVLFQERPDPVLFHRTGDATLRAVSQRARQIALGELPDPPAHAFVGRSHELLAAERLLCGRRMDPDHGAHGVGPVPTGQTDTSYAVFLGEGGEGKTTLAVELARWLVETHRFDQAAFVSVEQEASLHSVFSRLGRQLVSDYVARSANNDDDGRRLIEEVLVDRDTLLVIDNLESIVAADYTRRPDQAQRRSGTGSTSGTSSTSDKVPGTGADSRQGTSPDTAPLDAAAGTAQSLVRPTDDVLAPLFELLAELNRIGRTRIVFTTRTPLPAPFAGHHIRIDRLSEGDAVELVGNVLDRSSSEPRAGDAGESESEVQALVESVHCHARSLVLLAREVSEQGVTATTAALRELMQGLHERFGDDRERSLFASVELSLRRLPPDIRQQLPPLSVFHGGFRPQELAEVLGGGGLEAALGGLDLEVLMQQLGGQGESADPAAIIQRLMEIPELAAAMSGASESAECAADIARHLINVGLAEPLRHDHVRLHPALAPYLSSELTAVRRASAVFAWSEAMSQLTSHLYQQSNTDTHQISAELTLLELPNLLAALEHRFRSAMALELNALASGLSGESSDVSRATSGPAPGAVGAHERKATDLESVIGMATRLEGLLQNRGRAHALRAAGSIRVQAADWLRELRGDDAWSHAQFEAERAAIERLLGVGRLAEAVAAAEQLLARCRNAGESAYAGVTYDLAMAHLTLGRVLQHVGSAQAALESLAEARTRFERLGQAGHAQATRMASASLADYAHCLTALGRLDEAAAAYELTIEEANPAKQMRDIAASKGQLGTVRLLQRRYAEALAAWDEARQTFEQLGEPGTVATAWHQIGRVHQAAGQFEAAEHAYQQALHIKSSRGDRAGEASTLAQLGTLYGTQSHREEAVRFFLQAADIYAAPDIQDLAKEGVTRNNAANELIKLSRYDDARREILRAIECGEPFGHAVEPWKTFGILSNLEQAVGDAEASAAARQRAIHAYLAYRRDRGENNTTGGHLAALIH